MRPSLRFLAVAIVGWAGVRAASLGMLPGADMFSVKPSEAATPPIMATQFPEIQPIAPAPEAPPPFQPAAMLYAGYPAQVMAPPRPIVVPINYVYRATPPPVSNQAAWNLPEPRKQLYSPTDRADDWQISRLAALGGPAQSRVTEPMQSTAPSVVAHRLDRIQLAMWAMLRRPQDASGSPTSLASGGTLGGSQAGARLFYNFTPAISAVLRSSSDVGRRGGEVALGVRVRPLQSIPVWVTAERRQRLGKYGDGRNDFALFAETGVYGQQMPWGFTLDGYGQAGVVGITSRDLFADGALAFTRPLYRQFSAGFGVWGGVQPGLYRVDAGPRVTMQVRRNIRVHFDYRQRLAGNARPGSGPVVTLAGDF